MKPENIPCNGEHDSSRTFLAITSVQGQQPRSCGTAPVPWLQYLLQSSTEIMIS